MKIDLAKLIADPRWAKLPESEIKNVCRLAVKTYAETREYSVLLGQEPEGVPNCMFWMCAAYALRDAEVKV